MSAYVSATSEIFKLIKRALYEYVEGRATEAREMNKEFTKPMLSEHDVQVTVDVMQKQRKGDKTAAVATVTGKINHAKAMFLNQFLSDLKVEEFLKTPITLPKEEMDKFVEDIKMLSQVSPVRRQALLDVIKTVLPKVEGFGHRAGFNEALSKKDLTAYITFTDVSDVATSD